MVLLSWSRLLLIQHRCSKSCRVLSLLGCWLMPKTDWSSLEKSAGILGLQVGFFRDCLVDLQQSSTTFGWGLTWGFAKGGFWEKSVSTSHYLSLLWLISDWSWTKLSGDLSTHWLPIMKSAFDAVIEKSLFTMDWWFPAPSILLAKRGRMLGSTTLVRYLLRWELSASRWGWHASEKMKSSRRVMSQRLWVAEVRSWVRLEQRSANGVIWWIEPIILLMISYRPVANAGIPDGKFNWQHSERHGGSR